MHVKTMEGLVGAGTNMNLLNTPMRVYKEARRRGDTAMMERAMGYVSEFAGKAEEYKAETDEGMKEDAKAAKEKSESEREKAIQKRKEESEKLERRTKENKNEDTDMETDANMDTDKKEPVIYTKTGEASQNVIGLSTSISVSV